MSNNTCDFYFETIKSQPSEIKNKDEIINKIIACTHPNNTNQKGIFNYAPLCGGRLSLCHMTLDEYQNY